ncbi:hypothetical protein [Flavobacterium sp. N2038]|uniref:hypothetical protein n=1 Tax=Flavobacterium sp. N2038 TaxID=2986829 RepID=UPI00222577E7|nr:hypothetical protein [Flavobacterium sp. N2038]
MKQLLVILLTFTIISCKNKTQNTISKPSETVKFTNLKNSQKSNSAHKVTIDFKKNKDLLDIILLLPDSTFSSWEWKLEDRTKWYNEIKDHNYYIDNDPNFFNQKYFEPHKAGFSIVDGFWSINIYKTSENSYIVITDDIVGDGNSLNFYEAYSNILKQYLDEKTIFSDFKEQLKKKENTENCEDKFEEMNDPIFEFDFTTSNKVEIESSWYLTKENYENCLTGNAITYHFNPKTKKFEVEKIYWKPKNEN